MISSAKSNRILLILIPLVSFALLWFRANNNFLGSHLGDTSNPYFYLWIIASIVSSCYAYTWDVKMDWGLFEWKSNDNKFLREETVYSSNVREFG